MNGSATDCLRSMSILAGSNLQKALSYMQGHHHWQKCSLQLGEVPFIFV